MGKAGGAQFTWLNGTLHISVLGWARQALCGLDYEYPRRDDGMLVLGGIMDIYDKYGLSTLVSVIAPDES